ncbi:MAG: hypothetical protein WA810_11235, partial [Maribacter sp.]
MGLCMLFPLGLLLGKSFSAHFKGNEPILIGMGLFKLLQKYVFIEVRRPFLGVEPETANKNYDTTQGFYSCLM